MKRYGMVVGLYPDKIDEYKRLHRDVWPGVLKTLSENGVKNFTIFLKEPENMLFGSFEFHGDDYAAASARMAADPVTQEWWKQTEPCQLPLQTRKPGEWWAMMEEVFHMD